MHKSRFNQLNELKSLCIRDGTLQDFSCSIIHNVIEQLIDYLLRHDVTPPPPPHGFPPTHQGQTRTQQD